MELGFKTGKGPISEDMLTPIPEYLTLIKQNEKWKNTWCYLL